MDNYTAELRNRIRELESARERNLKDELEKQLERVRMKDNAIEFVQKKLRERLINSLNNNNFKEGWIEIPTYEVKDMIDYLQVGKTS